MSLEIAWEGPLWELVEKIRRGKSSYLGRFLHGSEVIAQVYVGPKEGLIRKESSMTIDDSGSWKISKNWQKLNWINKTIKGDKVWYKVIYGDDEVKQESKKVGSQHKVRLVHVKYSVPLPGLS